MPECHVCKERVLKAHLDRETNVCFACEISKRKTAPTRSKGGCPCPNPYCVHVANKPDGSACYHGYPNGEDYDKFMRYATKMQDLRSSTQDFAKISVMPEIQGFQVIQNELPLTEEFAMFLVCTAVDALVDGDPRLPPSRAPQLTIFALLVEKELSDDPSTVFHEIIRVRAGADIVPILTRRIGKDCHCLDYGPVIIKITIYAHGKSRRYRPLGSAIIPKSGA